MGLSGPTYLGENMKNFIQSGHRLSFVAGATIASGAIVQIGEYIGINSYDVVSGDEGELSLTGVYSVPKTAAVVLAVGDNAYLTAGEASDTNTDPLIGTVHKAAAGPDAQVEILLKAGPAAGMH